MTDITIVNTTENSLEAFQTVLTKFFWKLEQDKALRSRLRRCTSAEQGLMVPAVHRLYSDLGPNRGSVEGAARAAILLATATKDIPSSTLGKWISKVWNVSKDSSAGCEARLDALLRSSDPAIFMRLVNALASRSDGCFPFASTVRAVMDWDDPIARKRAAATIACDYASAT